MALERLARLTKPFIDKAVPNMNSHRSIHTYAACMAILSMAMAGCGGGHQSSSSSTGANTAVTADVSAPAPAISPNPVSPSPVSGADWKLSLGLISPAGGSKLAFTVGQGFRQGDVPAGQAVVANIPQFQSVVLNRWPDGSMKYAVLSGRADLVSNTWQTVGLTQAVAPPATAPLTTADLNASGVSASIQYGSYGTAAWNQRDWSNPVQTTISGPQMSAFTYRKPIGSDAHLVAWLEVRAYRDGIVEVVPWIENGYLNVAAPGSRSGTATFTLGGTQRFAQPLVLLNHQRAVLASGTALTHWYGANDPQVTPRHDTAYLMASKLVPNYRAQTASNSDLFSRLPTSYTPLMQASYQQFMDATGYDGSIGLLPEWDVAYLSTGADPRAYRSVLINAYAAGRFGFHYRDETTNRPIKFSSYPHLVMGDGSGVNAIGSASTNSYTPRASGDGPPIYDSPHHPSMGYMAYLLSGWNYFLEENQLLATANFLKQGDLARGLTAGLLQSNSGANVPRGAAWAMRTLAQAAALTPDGDPLKAEFSKSVDENINFYHSKYVAQRNNPLGFVEPYGSYSDADPWTAAPWMDDFFTASWGFMEDLAVNSAELQTKLDAFMQWKYVAIVGRLGSGAAGTYNYRYAAAKYTQNFAPSLSANWEDGSGPWYANWGVQAISMGVPLADGDTTLQGTSGGDAAVLAQGYWGNLHPALAYAVDHKAAGAAAAYARLIAASNYAPSLFNDVPVWSVVPRSDGVASTAPTPVTTTPVTPAPVTPAPVAVPSPTAPAASSPIVTTPVAGPVVSPTPPAPTPISSPVLLPMPAVLASLPVGQWLELPNTQIASVLPSTPQQGYPPAITVAWSGGTVDTVRNRLLVWGGGHSDYSGNEMYALDLPSLSIKRIVEPSPFTAGTYCGSKLSDGSPVARHTYDGMTYIAHADRMFEVNGSLATCGFGERAAWTRDFTTNTWQQVIEVLPFTNFGTMAVYDALTKQVLIKEGSGFYSYSLESNQYTKLNAVDQFVDYHLSAAIDSKRRKFVMLGDGVQVIDLATNAMTTMATTNAPDLVSSHKGPGIAYDPIADRIVAWQGGSAVYALNMDTGAWTQVATNAGPTSEAPYQGTFGRWGYVPQYRLFVAINSIGENGWVFRLAK